MNAEAVRQNAVCTGIKGGKAIRDNSVQHSATADSAEQYHT